MLASSISLSHLSVCIVQSLDKIVFLVIKSMRVKRDKYSQINNFNTHLPFHSVIRFSEKVTYVSIYFRLTHSIREIRAKPTQQLKKKRIKTNVKL